MFLLQISRESNHKKKTESPDHEFLSVADVDAGSKPVGFYSTARQVIDRGSDIFRIIPENLINPANVNNRCWRANNLRPVLIFVHHHCISFPERPVIFYIPLQYIPSTKIVSIISNCIIICWILLTVNKYSEL